MTTRHDKGLFLKVMESLSMPFLRMLSHVREGTTVRDGACVTLQRSRFVEWTTSHGPSHYGLQN